MLSTTFRAVTLALAFGGLAACSSDPLNTANRPDGTPGNPPGTAVSRANDRAGDPLNADGRRDGAPGNPPGTVVSRANERAGDPLNVDGRPDCTPGNPPGTAVSRSLGTTDPSDCAPRRSMTHRSGRTTHRAAVRRTTRPAAAPASTRVGGPNGPGGSIPPGGSSTTLSTQGS